VSTGPDLDLVPAPETRERNWLAVAIAAAVVLVVASVGPLCSSTAKSLQL